MSAPMILPIHGEVDRAGLLIAADEPLASFHRRSGGELPGPLVTPAFIEVVRKAMDDGLCVARPIAAQDDTERVTAWLEVTPTDNGAQMAIANWHAQPLTEEMPHPDFARRDESIRQTSALAVRLGPHQDVLVVLRANDELAALGKIMEQGRGKAWTRFVSLQDVAHHQPMHWRLLDGARIEVPGVQQRWRACLIPLGQRDPGSKGFELHLLADEPVFDKLAQNAGVAGSDKEAGETSGLGQEVALVLRQPVSRIIANAETIRTQLAGPLGQEYTNYAHDIANAGEHLLSLIDDLATLDAVESDDFSPAKEHVDLADIAGRAAGILKVRAQERAIEIALTQPAGPEFAQSELAEPVGAIAEFRRVLQIVLNLLGNAIRYAPEGSRIEIVIEAADGLAQISIIDTGEGLDENEQQRVFAKFERLGRKGDGGSGLGLYISRRLAEAMEGTLTVTSQKGQGACFTLALPLA